MENNNMEKQIDILIYDDENTTDNYFHFDTIFNLPSEYNDLEKQSNF